VGEPTNPSRLGEMIKIGRRGSLTATLRVPGSQGHTAYPQLADNPIPRLLAMLQRLSEVALDQGTELFQPSDIQITTVDVGNPASNVIPAEARAAFNIRFNDCHTGDGLTTWLKEQFDALGGAYELQVQISAEAFVTPPGPFSALLGRAVERVTGHKPVLSTTGGTSDARFIKDHCPVAEFGLVGQTMHKTDERITVKDLETLTEIYQAVLEDYFAA
jgi:succinyl-diaminopimelate desuccinylase